MRVLVKLGALTEYIRGSLWFGPTVAVLGAVVVGVLLTHVTPPEGSLLASFAFPGDAEGARGILRIVATSVITVVTLVFSLTVLTLQLASQQFSPRLLRTFLREKSNQAVLAVFLATFSYAMVVLRAVRSGSGRDEEVVPGLAVTVAFLLVLASIAAFVAFIDHIAQSLRIDTLLKQVEKDTRSAIDHQHPAPCRPGADGATPEPPGDAVPVAAGGSGFVTALAPDALERLALHHDVVLALGPKVGEWVVEGCPLVLAWPSQDDEPPPEGPALAEGVNDAVTIAFERTMQQDIAYGLRQLVDVAVKALSPGVNDPTTAVHAIGHLASILCVLAQRDLSPLVRKDEDGVVRVAVATHDLQTYLDLACRQIRLYGARDSVVAVQVLHLLRDVGRCATRDEHRRAVRNQALLVVAAAEREIMEPHDMDAVREAATPWRRP
ncbi:MAG: DUF2254 domain-containing protein [Actinomycetota bacterium]|nr:DUF2254 domain-containing protein [Actinomycetota bacterium]